MSAVVDTVPAHDVARRRAVPTESTVLEVRGLTVAYHGVLAVQDLDLRVRRGEVVAVVGASGSGKSTLAQSILGLLPDEGEVVSGTIDVAGHRIDTLGDRELDALRGAVVSLVPQDPGVGLDPVVAVGDQIAEALTIHGTPRRTARARAREILDRAGLDPQRYFDSLAHRLSGGQRQRVLIGIALACDPALVIADEPTSALDVTVQRRILDHLDERIGETGAGVVIITHDLALAAERSDRVVVMAQGRVVESGPTPSVLSDPRHEYTRRLLAASPTGRPRSDRGPGAGSGTPALEARGITRTFGDRTRALDSVSFTLDRGRVLGVVGESGSGKTTLARVLTGLDRADSGSVTFGGGADDAAALVIDGRDRARRIDRRAVWRRVALVHQNPYSSLDPRQRVIDIVAEPLRARGARRGERRARARRLIDRVGLPVDVARRRPAQLSGGQRQRVAIARALVADPQVVILDEPTSALDVVVARQILDLLDTLRTELDLTVVLISHDLAVVAEVADEVLVMNSGRVVESGPVATVFQTPADEYTRQLIAAIPRSRVPASGRPARTEDEQGP